MENLCRLLSRSVFLVLVSILSSCTQNAPRLCTLESVQDGAGVVIRDTDLVRPRGAVPICVKAERRKLVLFIDTYDSSDAIWGTVSRGGVFTETSRSFPDPNPIEAERIVISTSAMEISLLGDPCFSGCREADPAARISLSAHYRCAELVDSRPNSKELLRCLGAKIE